MLRRRAKTTLCGDSPKDGEAIVRGRRGELRFFDFSDNSVPSAGSLPHVSEAICKVCTLTEPKSTLSAITSNPSICTLSFVPPSSTKSPVAGPLSLMVP